MLPKSTTRRLSLRALCATLLGLTAALGLMSAPAQADPTTTTVHVWASQVRVRDCLAVTCRLATQEQVSNTNVQAFCQRWGGAVTDGPYYNHYWVEIITPQHTLGWISAVYVSGGSNDGPIPGVPIETDFHPVVCEYL
ncbi:hypothetical protein [Streptomyces sp. NRRL WC-3742]|uniref:hypothetical protein n=1 Tax=Streptomyces sp. NRRL WC-3742 TaxID=1463934 RepID=UPI00068D4950|nr:hypothetical protein [Streptomyces sp. NRRL WC-3742]